MSQIFDLCTQTMPLLLITHPFAEASFGLWQIAEPETFFRIDLPLSAQEESDLAKHHNPVRRLEWLAGRWLLHKLTDAPQRLPVAKDAFSKPFFPENKHLACSLSHSKGTVGALIVALSPPVWANGETTQISVSSNQVNGSETTPSLKAGRCGVGCDIQVLTEKMLRIAHKFLNEPEKSYVESRPKAEYLDLLHLFWTAKESLYKAYGLKELDFRKNIFVENIQWDGLIGEGTGRVEKGDSRLSFRLVFSKMEVFEGTELIWAVCEEA